jgi:hypothetical protein
MIYNYTSDPDYVKVQNKRLVGKPLNFLKRIKNYKLSNHKYLVIDGNDELIELFSHHTRQPLCKIEMRGQGIILWFRINRETMALPLPYYSLTVFKGSEYFQVYGGKWRVKLAITKDEHNNRDLIRQILLLKHDSTSDFTQYYG